MFAKWANQRNAIPVDKWFEPTTEDDIRHWIGNLYAQGVLGEKGGILRAFCEHS